MRKYYYFLIGLFLISVHTKAQIFKPVQYCDSTIFVFSSKYSRTYIMNDKEISSRVFIQRLNMFRSSSYEIKKFKLCSSVGFKFMYVSAASFLSGSIIVNSKHHYEPSLISSLMLTGLGSFGVSFFFLDRASKHYKNSLEFYNWEIYNRK